MRDFTPTATINVDEEGLHVETHFHAAGVDRTRGVGFGLGGSPKARGLAERLVRAIEAGRVFTGPKVMSDVNDATFVTSDCTVRGRCLNADLKSLGF